MASLREKQAVARRNQMLDAAETLIRQTGGTDFSLRELARIAEVSPATPYNFFDSKEGLLFGLLNRNLKPFMREALNVASSDPIEQALEAAENSVKILIRDPVFLRPLYRVMLSLKDPVLHPEYMRNTYLFYLSILNGAVEQNLFEDTEEDPQSLASALMAYFMGVLDLWIQEDIKDDMFRAQILYGYIRLLRPIARGNSVKKIAERHDEIRKVLSKRQLKPSYV